MSISINVIDKSKRADKVSATVLSDIKAATEFYMKILVKKRLMDRLEIEVCINPHLNKMAEVTCIGLTENPNKFRIEIRNHPNDDEILQSLAHECVHVKQFATNELSSRRGIKYDKNGNPKLFTQWMGEEWKPPTRCHNYYDSPWEVEAYGRETSLYKRFTGAIK